MPVELIPVLDIASGRGVHAVGGDRARYEPVRSALVPGCDGDALVLAQAYRTQLRASRCYVADLDAITADRPQRELLARLAGADGFGPGMLVDAGIRAAGDLSRLHVAVTPVVGLETLRHWDDLPPLLAAAPDLVFSLDLRDGQPLGDPAARPPGRASAPLIARALARLGVRELLVLDLARIGRGEGPAFDLLTATRAAAPGIRLLAGGGVRDAADLRRLEAVGVDGVLVASALHRGTLAVGRPQSPATDVR